MHIIDPLLNFILFCMQFLIVIIIAGAVVASALIYAVVDRG